MVAVEEIWRERRGEACFRNVFRQWSGVESWSPIAFVFSHSSRVSEGMYSTLVPES
jgi:hypothetical protein